MKKSKTRFAVLGILSYGPMSGYDIKKFYEQNVAGFWSESYGQIYPILKRLATVPAGRVGDLRDTEAAAVRPLVFGPAETRLRGGAGSNTSGPGGRPASPDSGPEGAHRNEAILLRSGGVPPEVPNPGHDRHPGDSSAGTEAGRFDFTPDRVGASPQALGGWGLGSTPPGLPPVGCQPGGGGVQ